MSAVAVVVGGQFGSEAKGHVTAQVIQRALKDGLNVTNVRVAGPNAGHTVYDSEGRKFAFRQIPVGAVLANGDARPAVLIAAGSEIDPPVLFKELEELEAAGHHPVVYVDENATLITDDDKLEEQHASLTARVGSTGKGIGAARAARVMRTAKRVKDDLDFREKLSYYGNVWVGDTTWVLNLALSGPDHYVIVEGTQGYGLGVHTKFYPQSTSSDARAIDFLAMAGISPWHPGVEDVTVFVVCRVYPIRVAGNSGPLKDETTWEALGLPEERTTVTQKVRRVGGWDAELVRDAVQANGGGNWAQTQHKLPAVVLAVTMVDQKFPQLKDFQHCEPASECTGHPEVAAVADEFNQFLNEVQREAGAPVLLATTGPQTALWF